MKRHFPFFYGYGMLAAVWCIYFCVFGTVLYSTSVINAGMQQAMGFSERYIGLAGTLCTLVSGLVGPLVGRLISKRGVRLTFLIGSAMVIASGLALAFLPQSVFSFLLLYGLVVGAGMGFAGLVSVQSAVNDWFDRKKSFAMAIVLTAGSVGGFMAPQIVERLLSAGNWTWGWRYVAAMAGVALVVSLLFIVNRPEDVGQFPDGLPPAKQEKGVAQDGEEEGPPDRKAFVLILFSYATRTYIYYSIMAYLVIFLRYKGFSSAYGADCIALISLFSLAGRLLMGVIPERRVPANVTLGLGNIAVGAGGLLICLFDGSLPIRIGAAAFGVGVGFVTVALPLTVSRAFGQRRFAGINGKLSLINYLLAAGGPAIVGQTAAWLNDYSLPLGFSAVLVIAGGVAAFFLRLRKES